MCLLGRNCGVHVTKAQHKVVSYCCGDLLRPHLLLLLTRLVSLALLLLVESVDQSFEHALNCLQPVLDLRKCTRQDE